MCSAASYALRSEIVATSVTGQWSTASSECEDCRIPNTISIQIPSLLLRSSESFVALIPQSILIKASSSTRMNRLPKVPRALPRIAYLTSHDLISASYPENPSKVCHSPLFASLFSLTHPLSTFQLSSCITSVCVTSSQVCFLLITLSINLGLALG